MLYIKMNDCMICTIILISVMHFGWMPESSGHGKGILCMFLILLPKSQSSINQSHHMSNITLNTSH